MTAEIYNMYGPTETTIWSTAYRVPDSADFGNGVPIGKPLGNTRAYIVNSKLQLVCNGEPGRAISRRLRGVAGLPATA